MNQWIVVSNGSKYRLSDSITGMFYTEPQLSSWGCEAIVKEWTTKEEAEDCAKNNSWIPV